jgi:hypothetical protein
MVQSILCSNHSDSVISPGLAIEPPFTQVNWEFKQDKKSLNLVFIIHMQYIL